jgi:inorganic triphosphatase YgiF
MSGLEIELKAGLSPAGARQLIQRLQVDEGAGEGQITLRSLYFDRPDEALAKAGIALRIRTEGGRRVQTLKLGRRLVGGFQQVRELDMPISGKAPRLDLVPDRAVRARLEKLAAETPLQPRHETQVTRTRWQVRAPGGLVEVALDRGHIRAGAARIPVLEVEFELLGGSPSALFALARHYLGESDAWLGLPNKAARGAALSRGEGVRAPALSSKPFPPAEGSPASDAFDKGLHHLAPAIAASLHRVLTTDDPEGPHQLRVALRRLRVLLKLHRRGLVKETARALGDEARRLGQIVSPLRDADVLVPVILAEPGATEAELQPHLLRMLARQRTATRRELQRAGATGFAIRLLELAALGGWRGRHEDVPIESRAMPVLRDLWANIGPRADALALLPEAERHELRKLLKKLRYSIEFTPKPRSKAFISCLKSLQEDLGELNDLSVLAHWQPSLGTADVGHRLAEAQAGLLTHSRRRADLALGRACRHWLALRGCELPWQPGPN